MNYITISEIDRGVVEIDYGDLPSADPTLSYQKYSVRMDSGLYIALMVVTDEAGNSLIETNILTGGTTQFTAGGFQSIGGIDLSGGYSDANLVYETIIEKCLKDPSA